MEQLKTMMGQDRLRSIDYLTAPREWQRMTVRHWAKLHHPQFLIRRRCGQTAALIDSSEGLSNVPRHVGNWQ